MNKTLFDLSFGQMVIDKLEIMAIDMINSEKIKKASFYIATALCLTAFAPDKGPAKKAGPVDPHANVNQSLVNAERQFQLAIIDLQKDDKDAALKKLDIGIKNYPDNFKMLSLRANVHLMSRRFFPALGDLNKAIRLQPDVPGLLVNRSLVYRSFKNYDQAMKDLDKAVELNPKLYSALFNRGTLYYGQKKLEKAVTDFKKCIHLASADPRPRHNMALALNEMGKRDEAIAVLETMRKEISDRHWRGVAAKQIRDWNDPKTAKAVVKNTVPNPHAKPKDKKVK